MLIFVLALILTHGATGSDLILSSDPAVQNLLSVERERRVCNDLFEQIRRVGGLGGLATSQREAIVGFADECPVLTVVVGKRTGVKAKRTIFVEHPSDDVFVSPPKPPTAPPPQNGSVPTRSLPGLTPPTPTSPPEDQALCQGRGVGWIEVLEHGGRISFAGGPPTQTTGKPGAMPVLNDRLSFQAPVKALVYQAEVPCLLDFETGCPAEGRSGDFVVAGRVVFANEVGGRQRWQLCVVRG